MAYTHVKLNLSEIYQKAWEITKKHKALWVFGMALAAFSGSNSFNFSRSFDSSNFKSLDKTEEGTDGMLDSAVKGVQSIRGAADTSFDSLKEIASQIPASTWIILSVCFTIAIIIGIIISLVAKNWAKGALIAGIDNAETKGRVWFTESSKLGLSKVKQLIKVELLTFILVLIPIFPISILIVTSLVLKIELSQPFLIMLAVGAFILVALSLIAISMLSMSFPWAQRLIALENFKAVEAVKQGYRIARKNLGSMLKLGFGNCLVSTGIGCITSIVIMIPIGIAVGGFLINKTAGVIASIPAAVIVLVAIFGGVLVMGILNVFKYTTWNILFKQIRGQKK